MSITFVLHIFLKNLSYDLIIFKTLSSLMSLLCVSFSLGFFFAG